jgi:hypothetical protein
MTKSCHDCRYFDSSMENCGHSSTSRHIPKTYSVATGRPITLRGTARTQRSIKVLPGQIDAMCGPAGRFWESRP